jgi:hypothetical protein
MQMWDLLTDIAAILAINLMVWIACASRSDP